MVLVALHGLGASAARLREYFARYRDANHLPPAPPPLAPIERANWSAALGNRASESDYRSFFQGEVGRLGDRAAIAAYLPTLLPGLAASATHGLMRLAYGVMRADAAEISTALGYWAATYLELGQATDAAPTTDDPAEILLRMRGVESFHHVETDLDLLWHFMRAVAAKPEFRPLVDWLAVGPGTFERMRAASFALCMPSPAATGCGSSNPSRPTPTLRCAISGKRSRRFIPRSALRICPMRARSTSGGVCRARIGPRSRRPPRAPTTSMI
jgi:hypothetical protein